MTKCELIDNLEKAANIAAMFVITKSSDIKKKVYSVNHVMIKHNSKNMYDLFDIHGNILYKDIISKEIAELVANKYSSKRYKEISNILYYENIYAKNCMDTVVLLNCYKSARKNNDFDRMYILEDKIHNAKTNVDNAKKYIEFMAFSNKASIAEKDKYKIART